VLPKDAAGRVVVVITGGTMFDVSTLSVNLPVTLPDALVACTVKVYDVVDVFGVPDMIPVFRFSVRPLGKLPVVMLHCIGMLEVAWRV